MNETVHFKFDRFETESDYDYLSIDLDNDGVNDYSNSTYNQTSLILDGSQLVDIWVTAESIQSFDIYFYSDSSYSLLGIRIFMECRVPLLSTADVFDIYSSSSIDLPTSTVTTTTTTARITTGTNTESTQYMKLTGSITTAYTFSDDLNDPESDMFKEYASTVESEMSSIMMRSSMVKSINMKVTGFQAVQAVSAARKRRQVEETKAMAEFEAFAEVLEDASLEDVQDAVESQIKSASDEELQSLDADSFNTIGVVVATTTTSTTSTASTTATSTTITTTTRTSPELTSSCPGGNEISPNQILETVQSVFNFLGGVFNFLAEREKNSHG